MKVKKAHVRTMLPVASAGFASFWAWFYLVLLSPYPASHAGDLSLALKLAFLVGVLAAVSYTHLRVRRERVDGHHARQVVHLRDVLHVLQEVRQAGFQRLEVLLLSLIHI